MKWMKNIFSRKPDYKKLYEEQIKVAQSWEFKYNKMRRQLKELLDNNQ